MRQNACYMGCGFFKYIKYLNFDLRFQAVCVIMFFKVLLIALFLADRSNSQVVVLTV